METQVLFVDVGATNVRIDFGHGLEQHQIGSVRELLGCLGRVIATGAGQPVSLVGGFAGAVAADRTSVCMTNWGAGEVLHAKDLVSLGCERVLLMNDLEASAWGLVELLEEANGQAVVALNGSPCPPSGNRVLVAPGTGLGSVGLVDVGDSRWMPVASEFQHMPIPAADDMDAEFLGRARLVLGRAPTWEDFVSGRGLELLFKLGAQRSLGADEIARLALAGDVHGRQALGRYYAVVGRFGRSLAMAYMAHGGVFMAGASTAANMDFVVRGDLARGFKGPAGEPQFALFGVPLELNLAGARRALLEVRKATGLGWSV